MAEGENAMRTALFLVLATAALQFVVPDALAQQYRWTDDTGRVHYSDTPPPAATKNVQKKDLKGSVVSSEPPFELQLAVKNAPVTLYTSPSCKQGCPEARATLNKRGVPFREVQVWDPETNELLRKLSGATQVPTLQVGSNVQKGFEQGAFDRLLDIAGYPKAGSMPERKQAAPPVPEGYAGPGTQVAPAPAAPEVAEKPPAQ